MTYKYITITARIAPLEVAASQEYGHGVLREQRVANAAPKLQRALLTFVNMVENDQILSTPKNRKQLIAALTAGNAALADT